MADDVLIRFRTDLAEFRKELDDVKKKVSGVGEEVTGAGSKINSVFSKVGTAIAGAFAIHQVTAFTRESIELAKQAEGIEKAFSKLNRAGLLNELRTATKGAVSDMRLMQAAVKADNFKLPLDQLAKLFKFAAQRAKDTGESVDFLVESIVLGISRKSIPILDNLGLSAAEIQAEFAKTGDMAVAVGNIIDQSFSGNTQTVETFSEKVDRMNASMTNAQVEFGKFAASVTDAVFDIEGFADFFRDIPKIINDETIPAWKKWLSLVSESTMKQAAGQADANNRLKEHVKYLTEQKVYTEKHRDVVLDSLEKQKKAITELQAKSQIENHGKPNILLDQLWWDLDAAFDRISEKPLDKPIKKATKATEENTKANENNAKALEDIDKARSRSLEDFQKDRLAKEKETNDAVIADQKRLDVEMNSEATKQRLAEAEAHRALEKSKTDITKAEAEKRRREIEDALRAAHEVSSSLIEASVQLNRWETDQAIDNLDQRRKAELNQKNLTEKQIADINAKYDKQRSEILREQWRKEKNAKIAMAIIDGAAAVVAALPNYVLAAAAAMTTGIQIGVMASEPEPKFHTGEVDIRPDGKRRMKGGEFRATLIEGESVINAKATAKYRDELEAINNQKFEDLLWKKHIMPIIREREKVIEKEMQQGFAANVAKSMMYQSGFNDGNIVEMLKRVNSTSKENAHIIASAMKSIKPDRRQP